MKTKTDSCVENNPTPNTPRPAQESEPMLTADFDLFTAEDARYHDKNSSRPLTKQLISTIRQFAAALEHAMEANQAIGHEVNLPPCPQCEVARDLLRRFNGK